jgi:hypothetical protein
MAEVRSEDNLVLHSVKLLVRVGNRGPPVGGRSGRRLLWQTIGQPFLIGAGLNALGADPPRGMFLRQWGGHKFGHSFAGPPTPLTCYGHRERTSIEPIVLDRVLLLECSKTFKSRLAICERCLQQFPIRGFVQDTVGD